MTSDKNKLKAIENFLNQLDILLSTGYLAYQQYLTLGKKLLHAKIIKANNDSITKLILNNVQLFQEEQRSDLLLIVYHINSWRKQWDILYKHTDPQPDDRFVFETIIKFPKSALTRLSEYYYKNFNKRLKSEM